MINKPNLSPETIRNDIKQAYKNIYNVSDTELADTVLQDLTTLFSGGMPGFLKCDTGYHDLLHTLQVVPPFIGIIDGWNKSERRPAISRESFDNGIIAVLLHDTGYIKTGTDSAGTGAKYAFVHTKRSAEFAARYLAQIGFGAGRIASVQNIIMCTGVRIEFEHIRFHSEEERIVGYALGTADLIGQMSAPDYLEKLPVLYREFEEAYRYEGSDKLSQMGMVVFNNADDLISKTPYFFEVVVKKHFENMGSVHECLALHFPDSRNHYLEEIEENIKKIKSYLARQ
jgi:hypothetical protein